MHDTGSETGENKPKMCSVDYWRSIYNRMYGISSGDKKAPNSEVANNQHDTGSETGENKPKMCSVDYWRSIYNRMYGISSGDKKAPNSEVANNQQTISGDQRSQTTLLQIIGKTPEFEGKGTIIKHLLHLEEIKEKSKNIPEINYWSEEDISNINQALREKKHSDNKKPDKEYEDNCNAEKVLDRILDETRQFIHNLEERD